MDNQTTTQNEIELTIDGNVELYKGLVTISKGNFRAGNLVYAVLATKQLILYKDEADFRVNFRKSNLCSTSVFNIDIRYIELFASI